MKINYNNQYDPNFKGTFKITDIAVTRGGLQNFSFLKYIKVKDIFHKAERIRRSDSISFITDGKNDEKIRRQLDKLGVTFHYLG